MIHPDPEKRPKVGKICEKKWFKEGRMASNEELKKYLLFLMQEGMPPLLMEILCEKLGYGLQELYIETFERALSQHMVFHINIILKYSIVYY